MKFFHTLIIIKHENSCNMAMSCLNQTSYQLLCTHHIIHPYLGTAQILVVIIIENQRNPVALQFPITIQIRARHTRLYSVYNKTAEILVHYSLEASAFIGEFIIRKKDLQFCLLIYLQHTSDAPNQFRLCASVLSLKNQSDFYLEICPGQFPGHSHLFVKICSAPPDAGNQIFLLQLIHCQSYSFTADTQPSA